MESDPSARVRLLGGFELFDLDGEPIRITGRRARGLMAMLCLEGRGGLLRDRICGLLWGDRPDEQARGSLRQCLFELRTALGSRADALLEVGRERVAIRPGSLLTDIDTLRAGLQSDDQDMLAGTASQLASGPLLEGLELPGPFQEWLDQARGAWEAALLDELTRRLAVLEAAGRWEAVRLLSEGYLRRDPLQETVAASAIRADLASDRPSAARRRYLAIRQALSDELGVAPGADLERAILAGAQDAPPTPLPTPPAVTPATVASPTAGPILAVLAFENQSGDPDFLYLSDGISEEILHAVSQTTPLKIIGRSSSFQLRGAEKSAANVAAQLGATHLLDGSVRRNGARVRITTQLVVCASQTMLWSDRFDRELSDVFALQDDISQAVAIALKSRFAGRDIGSVDPVVLDLYLRARDLRPDRLAYDARLLGEALERAPDFVPAWEALMYDLGVQARYGGNPEKSRNHLAQMEVAAERALALDPGTVVPFRVRAMTAAHCGAFAESERLINLCLARGASDPLDLIHAGGVASDVGRNRLALDYAQRAFELDPLNQVTFTVRAIYRLGVGNWAEARDQFDEGVRRWPDGGFLRSSAIVCAVQAEDWERVDLWARAPGDPGVDGPWIETLVAYAREARVANSGLATQFLASQKALLESTGLIALSHLGRLCQLGLADEAFALVEASDFSPYFSAGTRLAPPDVGLSCLFCVDQRDLRADPRFLRLCTKLGLCDYWVRSGNWPDCADEVDYDFRALARDLAAI
ncbi:MAG: BTAD domain-containing putative transcriptional regulator [Phenylobacterium sp.]